MQNGNNNNNFNNSGDNNTFHFSQSQGGERPVRMLMDENQSRIINKKEVRNKTFGSIATSISTMILGVLSAVSDCFGVGGKIGITPEMLLAVAVPLSLVPVGVNFDFIRYYLHRPRNKNEARFAGQGEIIQFKDEDNYLAGKMIAPCQHQMCSGFIHLTNTPPREAGRLQMNFVGICSISGRDHSYIVSAEWAATPAQFDWRPLDKE